MGDANTQKLNSSTLRFPLGSGYSGCGKIGPGKEASLRAADTTVDLQPDWMSWVKTAWWPIDRLPARRPFAVVMIVGRGVESQPGNNCERVTVARVDRNPISRAAFAVSAKLG